MKRNFVILIILCAVLIVSSCAEREVRVDDDYSSSEVEGIMQGFWHLTGYKGSLDESIKLEGVAMDIDDDEIEFYSMFEKDGEKVSFDISGGDTIKYKYNDERYKMDISFKNKDGYELMILRGEDETFKFEKTTYDAYYLYKGIAEGNIAKYSNSVYLEDELTDAELISLLKDTYWNELYYLYPDGKTADMDPYIFILYGHDMWGISQFVEDIYYIDWNVIDGVLLVIYSDDETYYFPVDYAYNKDTGYAYLYLYNTDEGQEGCAWVLWDIVDD